MNRDRVELIPFIAESAADAASQVRSRLGPQAVVVQVRPVAPEQRGWFRRRARPRFEVLAYRPDGTREFNADAAPGAADASAPLRAERSDAAGREGAARPGLGEGIGYRLNVLDDRVGESLVALRGNGPEKEEVTAGTLTARSGGGAWRVGRLLEASGFQAREAQRVVDRLRSEHGDEPPTLMGEELALAKQALRDGWRPVKPMAAAGGDVHVLVGAPGTGKTTCLSKWLTQVALGEGRPVRVWRLDSQTANTADALAVYCDVLGVPLARRWAEGDGVDAGEVGFVDLPGTDWKDGASVARLAGQLRGLRSARVHLVLNGAYDTALMLSQVRAFGLLPLEDLVVTHLDEEARWGKLWNLVLGTNYSVRFLSAGQNVPGDFQVATADVLLGRLFPG